MRSLLRFGPLRDPVDSPSWKVPVGTRGHYTYEHRTVGSTTPHLAQNLNKQKDRKEKKINNTEQEALRVPAEGRSCWRCGEHREGGPHWLYNDTAHASGQNLCPTKPSAATRRPTPNLAFGPLRDPVDSPSWKVPVGTRGHYTYEHRTVGSTTPNTQHSPLYVELRSSA